MMTPVLPKLQETHDRLQVRYFVNRGNHAPELWKQTLGIPREPRL
jgi:hypothetical protein